MFLSAFSLSLELFKSVEPRAYTYFCVCVLKVYPPPVLKGSVVASSRCEFLSFSQVKFGYLTWACFVCQELERRETM